MENAAEALKIAFAVMLFVMALTLSMSSFSQATRAVNAITAERDKEWVGDLNNDGNYYNDGYYKYNMYVTPSEDLTRTVGIETVVTSMYRAYEENMTIYFFESDGRPIKLYNKIDENGNKIEITCIDASEGKIFGSQHEPKEFLDILLGGKDVLKDKPESVRNDYKDIFIDEEDLGLYELLKDSEFEEQLGEYKDSTGLTKRVITYIKK